MTNAGEEGEVGFPLPGMENPTQSAVEVIINAPPPTTTVSKGEGITLSPTTTEAQDLESEDARRSESLTTERQSRINFIWEITQSAISLMIVAALIYCSINQISTDDLSNAVFLIIGFYFSRTNHQAIGGVGRKPVQSAYTGR